MLTAENKRLNGLVMEVSSERGTAVTRSTTSNVDMRDVHGLVQERDRLTAVVNDKQRETEHLKSRIGQLERSSHVGGGFDDSHLAQENQQLRLAVQDWQNKYSVLENLYISLRETTEQLDVIKTKNQNIINMSEQAEPRVIILYYN